MIRPLSLAAWIALGTVAGCASPAYSDLPYATAAFSRDDAQPVSRHDNPFDLRWRDAEGLELDRPAHRIVPPRLGVNIRLSGMSCDQDGVTFTQVVPESDQDHYHAFETDPGRDGTPFAVWASDQEVSDDEVGAHFVDMIPTTTPWSGARWFGDVQDSFFEYAYGMEDCDLVFMVEGDAAIHWRVPHAALQGRSAIWELEGPRGHESRLPDTLDNLSFEAAENAAYRARYTFREGSYTRSDVSERFANTPPFGLDPDAGTFTWERTSAFSATLTLTVGTESRVVAVRDWGQDHALYGVVESNGQAVAPAVIDGIMVFDGMGEDDTDR